MEKNTTQWRRERQTAAILENAKYVVGKAGEGLPFHLLAIGAKGIRFILVESTAPKEYDPRRLAALKVPPMCSREIWRWKLKKRAPEIVSIK